jgi:FtsP/CotA-like multicopper oxidase with cupredoxin domain
MNRDNVFRVSRRDLLKMSGAMLLGSPAHLRARSAFAIDDPVLACAGGEVLEVFPTSPLVGGYIDSGGVVRGSAFTDPLPIPSPLAPVPLSDVNGWLNPPGSALGQQDSDGATHQIWPQQLGLPDPVVYRIKVEVGEHRFSTLKALPIDVFGNPVGHPVTRERSPRVLPASTIYGFNGTFPGPMIYARYGQPALVRFENHLDENPLNLDRCDFGDPEWGSLTHLHNGHTAPESDGNPHWRPQSYAPGQWVDNLYLNWPAGGNDAEKQSFLWFHDHRMDHTAANVYKGMVGLYPIYDPLLDPGDETQGLRLPGVPNASTGRIDYDIPLALYDCALDDGVTPHKDFHNGCGETHSEWWGKTYFRHFPNHGFVGDVFTINGVANPVLHVKRRKYRLRFLGASIARIYELRLMSSSGGPKVAPGEQGQYSLPDGQQCMRFTQIASEGGLLPFAITRNSFEVWPAKRREVIVDFTKYMDGSPTAKDDVVYLVNTKKMTDGRKPDDSDDSVGYRVPMLKIVIGDDAPDRSLIPAPLQPLRPLPVTDIRAILNSGLRRRRFELERSGTFGGEIQWLINGLPFDQKTPLAFPKRGVPEIWTIENGGGGWVHPIHLHEEEHLVLSRDEVMTPRNSSHPDDLSKEDVIALGPGESVQIYRNFRTFTGPYVAHCHNLAHEDHAMMFGWTIVP